MNLQRMTLDIFVTECNYRKGGPVLTVVGVQHTPKRKRRRRRLPPMTFEHTSQAKDAI